MGSGHTSHLHPHSPEFSIDQNNELHSPSSPHRSKDDPTSVTERFSCYQQLHGNSSTWHDSAAFPRFDLLMTPPRPVTVVSRQRLREAVRPRGQGRHRLAGPHQALSALRPGAADAPADSRSTTSPRPLRQQKEKKQNTNTEGLNGGSWWREDLQFDDSIHVGRPKCKLRKSKRICFRPVGPN